LLSDSFTLRAAKVHTFSLTAKLFTRYFYCRVLQFVLNGTKKAGIFSGQRRGIAVRRDAHENKFWPLFLKFWPLF
jgi:hypothetical protein